MELSKHEVVHRHGHLSHMGLPIMPMGPKLVKSGTSGVQTLASQASSRLCRTHISETAGQLYSIQGSVELSRLVELCLGLPMGQKLINQINLTGTILVQTSWNTSLWNHWMDFSSMLSCDFRPLTIISDYLRSISDVFVKLSPKKNIVEEIESIMGACVERSSPLWVCIPQKSHLKKAVSQEWEGWYINMERWGCQSIQDAEPTMQPWAITLALEFQGQIFKKLYPWSEMADWHRMKAMWVGRLLDPLCDLDL